jgi:hypothetical protein
VLTVFSIPQSNKHAHGGADLLNFALSAKFEKKFCPACLAAD